MDWHDTALWLETHNVPLRLAWEGETLVGIMAGSIPLNNTCWLRVIAVEDGLPIRKILRTMWESLREELVNIGIHTVAILIVNDWLSPILPMLDFEL